MTFRFSNYSLAIVILIALGTFNTIIVFTSGTVNFTGTVYLINTILLAVILIWQFIFTGRGEQIIQSNQDDDNHKRLNTALNFQALGKLDTAYSIYKQCEPSQKIITLLLNLASDYIIVGRKNDALTVYKHALSLQPSNSSIKIKIDELLNDNDAKNSSTELIANRFQLIKLLGRGTQSSVYLANDLQSSHDFVALKIMEISTKRKNHLDEELLKRFLREAQTASSLDHPNIIKIIDSGQSKNIAYIAMEHIKGKSLREYADSTTLLPTHVVFDLMSQCAEALHYAHKKGIVHRDVKPANILFDNNNNIAKLGDFGIARIANSTQTIAGAMLGTPYYMSPEQLVGIAFDARSDIFSLGATLFRLLTGTTPFKGNSMAELMKAIVNEPHQDLMHIRPNLPKPVIKLVDKCLEKDPKRRYNSAEQLARELKICSQLTKN
jgi:serine/threonine-protein kinase